ncbi:hypothetical protein SLS58_009339 [Diplodia intermedia]|uniref:Uncharacterized protein n=1 Tax=Diplodia intermedia TaxID=856260 RepID=A0ABR3TCS1_9PEZI
MDPSSPFLPEAIPAFVNTNTDIDEHPSDPVDLGVLQENDLGHATSDIADDGNTHDAHDMDFATSTTLQGSHNTEANMSHAAEGIESTLGPAPAIVPSTTDISENDQGGIQQDDVASLESPAECPPTKLSAPTHLRPAVLLGYALAFALTIAALELLDYFSRRNNGIATVDEKYYYFWKYGPTFFFHCGYQRTLRRT